MNDVRWCPTCRRCHIVYLTARGLIGGSLITLALLLAKHWGGW